MYIIVCMQELPFCLWIIRWSCHEHFRATSTFPLAFPQGYKIFVICALNNGRNSGIQCSIVTKWPAIDSKWTGNSSESQLSVVLACKVFKSALQLRADYGTCLWTKNGYNSAETLLALICLQSIDRAHTDLSSDCWFDYARLLEHL